MSHSLAHATRSWRPIVAAARGVNPHARFSSTVRCAAEEYDIVIIGGGPVGLALANALGSSSLVRQHLHVALIEASDLSKVHEWVMPQDQFSNRVSSLTNASRAFLNATGAWDSVDAARTCNIDQMQIWDGISDARVTFEAAELNLPEPELGMASLTENLNLQRALLRSLNKTGGIQLLDKTTVDAIGRSCAEKGGWPLVHLSNNRTLRTRLLVGADGINSPVRSYANISTYGWSYERQAIVATIFHRRRGGLEGRNKTAYQRFLPTGPIAFLPLSPLTSSLVWSTRPHLAKALLNSDPAVLASMINAVFRLPAVSIQYLYDRILDAFQSGKYLAHSELTEDLLWRERSHGIHPNSAYASTIDKDWNPEVMSPPDFEALPPLVTSIQPGTTATFPLRYNHADSYLGKGASARTVLVGDAAHTIHPLAGQGLNLGLADVECLARCIDNALALGGDIGSFTALLPYSQERYIQNHTMLSIVDKLHKLYCTDLEPIVAVRTMGVEALNELESLKAALMVVAGAQQGLDTAGGFRATRGWDLAAKGVEVLTLASRLSSTIVGGLRNT